MAEPFKQTPASRVFGFGLRPQQPAPTFFGTPILADRNRLSPYLRQNAFEEQQMAAQEEALAAQQQQMAMQQQIAMRNQQIMDAEMAAEQDLAAGEQLGNIFKKNPALAFSRNAGQFASAAQMMQPSNAMKAAIPSLAMKLPIEERGIFNQLLNDPEFSANPFAAYDEAQRRSARARQHGELVKAGVPLSKIDTTRDYAPVEFEDLIQQHKQKSANPRLDYLKDFMDNVGKRVAAFEESDGAFDEKGNPTKALVDLRNKYAQISDLYDQEMMGLVMPKQAASDAVTAQKITAPPSTKIEVLPPIQLTKEKLQSVPLEQRDEAHYEELLSRSDLTPDERKKSEQEFKSLMAKDVPKEKAGPDILSAKNRPQEIKQREEKILNLSKKAQDEKDWINAWEESKNKVVSAIEKIAKETGYSPKQVAASLKSGQKVYFKLGEESVSLEQWLGKLLKSKEEYGVPLLGSPDSFKNWATTSLLDDVVAGMYGRSPPIWSSVVDDVLKKSDKFNLAQQDADANVVKAPKIQIGTPTQTSR